MEISSKETAYEHMVKFCSVNDRGKMGSCMSLKALKQLILFISRTISHFMHFWLHNLHAVCTVDLNHQGKYLAK